MRRAVAALILIATPVAAAGPSDPPGGEWSVDLRPSPASRAYLKPMRLAVAPDGTVSGSFYDNAIAAGRASESNGRRCFAFRTADASGAYEISGCLMGGRMDGQTGSVGRGFLPAWTAKRP
jgi:hypothetical protein